MRPLKVMIAIIVVSAVKLNRSEHTWLNWIHVGLGCNGHEVRANLDFFH